MSLDAAGRFTALLIENPILAAELSAATAGKSPEEKAVATAQMAKPLGYEFTPQEAREARDVAYGLLSRSPSADGELTEQQLEAVTGGATVTVTSVITKAIKSQGTLNKIGSTGAFVGLGGSMGPAGLVGAAVGGAANTIDSDEGAAQAGVTTEAIVDKALDFLFGW